LALDDAVVLAAGNDSETPETLGLIAHELSHVARRSDPQAAPPDAPTPAAEENRARALEGTVVRRARVREQAPASAPAVRVPQAAPPRAAPGLPPAPQPDDQWGGLPAPWEPMPTWTTQAWSGERGDATAPAPAAPAAQIAPAAQATYAPPALAEVGRSVDGGNAPAPAQSEQQHAPEPDLDALARQVYAKLKQRLAAERRRLE
jgi:hypothetical protein